MNKKYTEKDYADKAVEANREGKKLYIWVHEIEKEIEVPDYDEEGNIIGYHTEIIKEEVAELLIAEPNYYICYEANYTDGTVNPDFDTEEAAKRENWFKSEFFNIENFGWYRKQPKGYQSAVESMNVLFNIANVTDGIQAGLIIFYQQPDFTNPEECTEEWLVEHQIIMPAMTKAEFMALYVAFMTAWNMEEHN